MISCFLSNCLSSLKTIYLLTLMLYLKCVVIALILMSILLFHLFLFLPVGIINFLFKNSNVLTNELLSVAQLFFACSLLIGFLMFQFFSSFMNYNLLTSIRSVLVDLYFYIKLVNFSIFCIYSSLMYYIPTPVSPPSYISFPSPPPSLSLRSTLPLFHF